MQPGFKIDGVIYEIPQRFRMGDAVLVKELTGLEFEDFAARIDDMNEAIRSGEKSGDMLAITGLMGVAVWQKNERWTRDRVRRYVENFDMGDMAIEGGDEPPLTEGAAPPNLSPDESSESTSIPEPSEAKALE